MGNSTKVPHSKGPSEEEDECQSKLGDLLEGRLADADIDSVEAVRDERKP